MSVAEDILFLRELQEELKSQDRDCQASPRFWVIGDYERIRVEDGEQDEYHVVDWDNGSDFELDEYLKNIDVDELSEIARDEYKALFDFEDDEDKSAWVKEYCLNDDYQEVVPMKRMFVIKQNTMFLTKAEAKRHLELNRHHFSAEAHTYAMTACRAPMVERLLSILENFDWSLVAGLQSRVEELEKAARIFVAHSATSCCPEQDEDCDRVPSCEVCWLRALGLEEVSER